jgi:hypothetical protein
MAQQPWEKYGNTAEAAVRPPWEKYGETSAEAAKASPQTPGEAQVADKGVVPADIQQYGEAVEQGKVPMAAEQPVTATGLESPRGERLQEEIDINTLEGYKKARPYLETTLEGLGLGGGAVAGTPAGPAGQVTGGALGYAGAKRVMQILDEKFGYSEPETLGEAFKETAKDVATGAAYEAGGAVLSKALPVAAKVVGGETRKRAAKKLYQSSVKMPTTIRPAERAKIAETGLKEKVYPTSKGLGKLADVERALITKIDDAVEVATKKGDKVKTSDIIKSLDDAYDMAKLSEDPLGYSKIIDKVADNFKMHGEEVTVKQAHQMKRNMYKLLPSKAFEKSFTGAETMKIKGRKAIARGAKEAVEAKVPGIKEMNKRAGELIDLNNVLERAVSRIENRNLIGLNDELTAVLGAQVAGGPAAAGMGAGRKLLGLPRTKAWLAMRLYKSGMRAEQLAKFTKTFSEHAEGKQFMREYNSRETQKILKSKAKPATKEKWLKNLYKKTIGNPKGAVGRDIGKAAQKSPRGGDTITGYHGTKGDFQQFDIKKAGQTDTGLVGKAVYFSPDEQQALHFAKDSFYGKGSGTPRVVTSNIKLKKPFIIKGGKLPDGRSLTDVYPKGINKKASASIERMIKKSGHDGVIFETEQGEVTQIAVYDISKISK